MKAETRAWGLPPLDNIDRFSGLFFFVQIGIVFGKNGFNERIRVFFSPACVPGAWFKHLKKGQKPSRSGYAKDELVEYE
jgi:hypothetical protein